MYRECRKSVVHMLSAGNPLISCLIKKCESKSFYIWEYTLHCRTFMNNVVFVIQFTEWNNP